MNLYQLLESLKTKLVELSRLLHLMPNKNPVELMVRRVCAEEGMTPEQTEIITAIIWAESGMNPKAEGKPNKNGTRDWGLCQFNDGPKNVPPQKKYWIGPKAPFPSVEYVLNNPEQCVRVMCRHIKKTGRYRDWSAFNNKSYRKFLKV